MVDWRHFGIVPDHDSVRVAHGLPKTLMTALESFHGLPQDRWRQVSISHRRRDFRMPEELLDRRKRNARCCQVRRKRVTKEVPSERPDAGTPRDSSSGVDHPALAQGY